MPQINFQSISLPMIALVLYHSISASDRDLRERRGLEVAYQATSYTKSFGALRVPQSVVQHGAKGPYCCCCLVPKLQASALEPDISLPCRRRSHNFRCWLSSMTALRLGLQTVKDGNMRPCTPCTPYREA